MDFFIAGMRIRRYLVAAVDVNMFIKQQFMQTLAFIARKIGNQCFIFFQRTGIAALLPCFNKLQCFGYAAHIADSFFVFNKLAGFGNKFFRRIFSVIHRCHDAMPGAVQQPVSLFTLIHALCKFYFVLSY